MTLGQQQSATKQAIARVIKVWAGNQYRTRGDSFATLPELKSICSDPLGWFALLKGYDAYEVLHLVYWHDLI